MLSLATVLAADLPHSSAKSHAGLATLALLLRLRHPLSLPALADRHRRSDSVAYFLGLEQMGVKMLGAIPQGLPPFSPPPATSASSGRSRPARWRWRRSGWLRRQRSRAGSQADRPALDNNQEFVGQGMANIAAACSPATPARRH